MNRQQTTLKIAEMDCPCEENIIRMKLQEFESIKQLDFDLQHRTLKIVHTGNILPVQQAIASLNFNSKIIETIDYVEDIQKKEDTLQRKILWIVLAINFGFFAVEILTGLISHSMGLLADALDMLADALVYGLSLWAVGTAVARKKRVAAVSGYLQLVLAILGFAEVIKRVIYNETEPDFLTMIVVSVFALAANIACLLLLQKSKSKEAHIQATIIFSSNDIFANAGIIVAALLVWWLNSAIPDLIIGSIVFILVIRGALRILKLAKPVPLT